MCVVELFNFELADSFDGNLCEYQAIRYQLAITGAVTCESRMALYRHLNESHEMLYEYRPDYRLICDFQGRFSTNLK
jgi:hypothetical protein